MNMAIMTIMTIIAAIARLAAIASKILVQNFKITFGSEEIFKNQFSKFHFQKIIFVINNKKVYFIENYYGNSGNDGNGGNHCHYCHVHEIFHESKMPILGLNGNNHKMNLKFRC